MKNTKSFKKLLTSELSDSVHAILSKKNPGSAKAITKTVKDAVRVIVKKFTKRMKEDQKRLKKVIIKKKAAKSPTNRRSKPLKKKTSKS